MFFKLWPDNENFKNAYLTHICVKPCPHHLHSNIFNRKRFIKIQIEAFAKNLNM